MTEKQKKFVEFLESLVGKRVTQESLSKMVSEFLGEEIFVINNSSEKMVAGIDDELTDYNFMFNSEKEDTYGYFDIYALPMRRAGFDGAKWYITEISYEFE